MFCICLGSYYKKLKSNKIPLLSGNPRTVLLYPHWLWWHSLLEVVFLIPSTLENEEPLVLLTWLDHFSVLANQHRLSLDQENSHPVIKNVNFHIRALKVSTKLDINQYHPLSYQYWLTCKQIAVLTRHPNDVETALGDKLNPENSFVNDWVRAILGRSSATTTHVRTQAKFTPFCFNWGTEPPRPFVQSSITPKEKIENI